MNRRRFASLNFGLPRKINVRQRRTASVLRLFRALTIDRLAGFHQVVLRGFERIGQRRLEIGNLALQVGNVPARRRGRAVNGRLRGLGTSLVNQRLPHPLRRRGNCRGSRFRGWRDIRSLGRGRRGVVWHKADFRAGRFCLQITPGGRRQITRLGRLNFLLTRGDWSGHVGHLGVAAQLMALAHGPQKEHRPHIAHGIDDRVFALIGRQLGNLIQLGGGNQAGGTGRTAHLVQCGLGHVAGYARLGRDCLGDRAGILADDRKHESGCRLHGVKALRRQPKGQRPKLGLDGR